MITKDEIQKLLHSTETYRVERTTSTDARSKSRGQARLDYVLQGGRRREPTGDMDKFQEAICAFAIDNGGKVGGKVGGDVPSLSPVCPQLSEVQLKKIVSVIVYLLRASGSITELMDCAGEKNKSRFRQTILKPLVDTGLVEPTIKDIPNSPNQKYALTDNGRENLQTIS